MSEQAFDISDDVENDNPFDTTGRGERDALPTRTNADGEVDLTPTPGQTVGPFFGYALPFAAGGELVDAAHPRAVRLYGTVYDGVGDPVPDALIEVWQADEHGKVSTETGSLRRDGWTFTGFGRTPVDHVGRYTFTTVEPGPTSEGAARYVHLCVFARGLLDRLHTRIYLPEADQPEGAFAADPLLSSLTDAERATLVAVRDERGGLRADIRLQGEGETVFLEFDGFWEQ